MMSHVFVLFTDLYNQWLRFVHSITKKQGTLVMAITHSFQSILTTDGSIRIKDPKAPEVRFRIFD